MNDQAGYYRVDLDQYEENGFLVIPTSKNQQMVSLANQCKNLAESLIDSGHKGNFQFQNEDGNPRQVTDILRHDPVFLRTFNNEIVKKVVKEVLDEERYFVTHSKLSFKTPGGSTVWSPHQDNGYKTLFGEKPREGLTLMIMLENVNQENGSIQFFPGSHLKGPLPHYKQTESKRGDFQIIVSDLPNSKPISIRAKAGDICIFSLNTVHQSGPTNNNSKRFVVLAEISPYKGQSVDGNGGKPILVIGNQTKIEKFKSSIGKFLSIKALKYRLKMLGANRLLKLYRSLRDRNI